MLKILVITSLLAMVCANCKTASKSSLRQYSISLVPGKAKGCDEIVKRNKDKILKEKEETLKLLFERSRGELAGAALMTARVITDQIAGKDITVAGLITQKKVFPEDCAAACQKGLREEIANTYKNHAKQFRGSLDDVKAESDKLAIEISFLANDKDLTPKESANKLLGLSDYEYAKLNAEFGARPEAAAALLENYIAAKAYAEILNGDISAAQETLARNEVLYLKTLRQIKNLGNESAYSRFRSDYLLTLGDLALSTVATKPKFSADVMERLKIAAGNKPDLILFTIGNSAIVRSGRGIVKHDIKKGISSSMEELGLIVKKRSYFPGFTASKLSSILSSTKAKITGINAQIKKLSKISAEKMRDLGKMVLETPVEFLKKFERNDSMFKKLSERTTDRLKIEFERVKLIP